jgi:hypothetical protein
MIFIWILVGIAALVALLILINWWRDEQYKKGVVTTLLSPPFIMPGSSSPPMARHPSIDPYLAELREYLLTPPLPQGPGEMAERVYTHLNQWVNIHLTEDALHNVDLESELLIEPTPRFVNMSRNEATPPPGYLEELMSEEQ